MLVAVIAHAAVVAGDGHGDLVGHGGDLQRTLVLLDAVVAGLETHGRGIDDGVRLLAVGDVRDGAGGADSAHLTRNEPVTRDGDIGACQGLAVIDLLVRGGGQLDGARGDRQRAVLLHDKRDALEVFVRILELAGIEMHQIAARVGALRRGIAGEGEVLLRIERIFRGKRVAGRGVLVAVIGHGFGVAGDGHNDAADRHDRQQTVLRLGHDILFRGVHRADRSLLELRGISADIRPLRTDGDGAEVRAVGRAGEAGDAVLVAVIGHGTAVRGQGDVLSGHLELTVAADSRVGRRPAAEHIAVQLGLCGHGHVRVHLVGFIRGQLSKCAGGNIALVLILHLIARDRPLDAGDGELEGLVAAGEGSLRIRGIILALFEVLAGGVELHRVGEPIGVGGLAAVGRFYAVRQLPRIGLAVLRPESLGLLLDADVRPHRVAHGTAADAGRDGGGDGLERRIELAAVRGVIGVLGVRGRGGGDVFLQKYINSRTTRICVLSGRAKADRVYTGGCSQRGRRVGRLVINRPAAIGAIAVTSRLRRRAIRQGNDISAVLGDAAHRRLRELIRRVFKTRIQIRTAIRGKAPDCLHNSVVASRGGDILPVTFNACTSGKAHEGDIAANARGIALVAVKEIGRRSFCCRKTGLFSFDRIIGEPIVPVGLLIMLTTGCVVILLTTLGAVVHRAGGIEHQHGRGRAGRRGRGGLGGLDLQINPVGVVAERGRFLAQRDGVSVTGFILNRPGALLVLCPCRACAVIAVNHVAAAFVFSENRRGQQAQRQTHGHDERENSFFHVYTLSFQILCVLRPPRRQRKRALALLRLKNFPARSCQPQSRLRFPSNGCAGHQHSPCSRIYFTTNHNVRQPFRRNFPINIMSIFHTFL